MLRKKDRSRKFRHLNIFFIKIKEKFCDSELSKRHGKIAHLWKLEDSKIVNSEASFHRFLKTEQSWKVNVFRKIQRIRVNKIRELLNDDHGSLLHQGQFAKQLRYVDQCSLSPHLPQDLHCLPFEPFTGYPVKMQT